MARKPEPVLSPRAARRQRRRLKFLSIGLAAFIMFVAGVGVFWLISQNRSTEFRSQASVNFTYSLALNTVPEGAGLRAFDVVMNAQSELAYPTAFSGEIVLVPANGNQRVISVPEASVPVGHRLLAEDESWIVSTELENAIQFASLALEPVPATVEGKKVTTKRVAFSARATNGSNALQGQKAVLRVTSKKQLLAQDGWANAVRLLNPSIVGYLNSAPGAELDLLKQTLENPEPLVVPVSCPTIVRKCPLQSSLKTSPEYPCGACVEDATGRLVGPGAPSPQPLETESQEPRTLPWGRQ